MPPGTLIRMDFFQSQDVARRKTGLLIVYFAAAVVLMIAALYVAAVYAFGRSVAGSGDPAQAAGAILWWQPELLLIVTFVVLAIVGSGSLYKTLELRGGGESVATMLGGRQLNGNTSDLAEQRLLNVVEEMALASGIAVPPVYVLDQERGINAFAAGFTPDDAVIGVNRGTIDTLTRDELQGVIAHEFSHILNGDMRLNIRLIGILHGILLISVIGYYALRVSSFSGGSSRNGKGGGAAPIMLIGFAALVVGYIGLFFGRLIKAAVSRQREYLADASAVQFTRNPDGIAGALKKIGGLETGSRMRTPEAESASHMFFSSARQQFAHSPLATHPPLEERISRIDPQFDGRFPPVKPVQVEQVKEQPAEPTGGRPAGGPALGGAALGGALGGALDDLALGGIGREQRMPIHPLLILGAVGAPRTEHVQHAVRLLQSLAPALRSAVRESFSARSVIYALLLDADESIRRRQLELLEEHEGEPARRDTVRLQPLVEQAGVAARLPLIEMAQGTLQQVSAEQYESFHAMVNRLVEADEQISLFEFVLQRVLLRRLQQHFGKLQPTRTRFHALTPLKDELACLLSALAHLGHPNPDEAQHAYDKAMAVLVQDPQSVPIVAPAACSLAALGKALDQLAAGTPGIKRRVLHAATVAVMADDTVTLGEGELLRAVADGLDCPMPPILPADAELKHQ